MFVESKNGLVEVNALKFKLNDEDPMCPERTIKSNSYDLIVTDVTKGLPSRF